MLLKIEKSIIVICSATSTDLRSRNIFEKDGTTGGYEFGDSTTVSPQLANFKDKVYFDEP